MKRDPGKEHTILLNIIHGFTSPQLAHIEKKIFYANGKPISFQQLIPSLFSRAITCLSTCQCGSSAFHLLPHNSSGSQAAPFGGKRAFAVSCACSLCTLQLHTYLSTSSGDVGDEAESLQQISVLPTPSSSQRSLRKRLTVFPQNTAFVCRYLWGQDNSSREHSSAQTNAEMSLPSAFRVALPISLCFIFQLS